MRTCFCRAAALVVSVALLGGCSQQGAAPAHGDDHTHADGDHGHDDHAPGDSTKAHDHSGWWCNEHGVPEEVCALCDSKLAADFQKKGDWCAEHERPNSQCFKCHPELQAKFASQYEAKYGKQPPKPEL